MKKLILVIIAVLLMVLPKVNYGQTFPLLGTTWYYTIDPGAGCFPCPISFQKMECTGDTLINGISCMKLHKSGTTGTCSDFETNDEYVYSMENIVYWYNSNQDSFTILYNFNANAGDSWDIAVYDCSFTVFVDSVSISSYNGINHKNLFISDINNYFTGKIVENIGHMDHFFPSDIYAYCRYSAACDGQFEHGLRCYTDSGIGSLNFTGISCDSIYYVNIDEQELRKELVEIFPNPCKGSFCLSIRDNIDKNGSNRFELFNSNGKMILEKKISDQKTYVSIDGFANGIYLLHIILNDKNLSRVIILQ
jgi:phage regulator Rha-like protein